MSFISDAFFGGDEEEAAEIQADAAREAARLTQQQFEDVKGLTQPFITGGAQAFEKQAALSGGLGQAAQAEAFQQYTESPGVQFLREQGLRGIESQSAVTGGLGSGDRLRRLTEYSQGLALQDFGNQFNRLGAITGAGLGALGSLGGVSTASAAGQSQAIQNAGAAQAAGVIGSGQGLVSGITGLATLGGALLSDIRLKTNVERLMKIGNLWWCKWDWTEEGKRLAGSQPEQGFIAQDVQAVCPDAVTMDGGFMRIDYGRIANG